MKVSFVTTVLNEEGTIEELLDSLFLQSRKPNEIVIVDAGSSDETISLIKKKINKNSISMQLIIKRRLNRSQARNLGIKRASHDIIAVSDAGCRLNKDWLKEITRPLLNKKADSVAGFYYPQTNTIFQKCVAPFVGVMSDKLDIKTYLPSSRSIAFTRSAWLKAGKYPEKLDYCEDLIFASKLKRRTKMVVKPEAIVYWHQANNIKRFFQQISDYASGDVVAVYHPHLLKIASVFGRYLVFLFFPYLTPFYLIWPIIKIYRYVNHPLGLIYLPILQITADLAVIKGSLVGLFQRLKTR